MQQTMQHFSKTEEQERARVVQMMLGARTLAQVQQASAALVTWRVTHPEDTAILSGGEMLFHAQEYAESREAAGRAQGFYGDSAQERERVFVQAEAAISVAEIARARKELLLWQWQYLNCDQDEVQNLLRHLNQQETIAHLVEDALTEFDSMAIKHRPDKTVRSEIRRAAEKPQPVFAK